MTFTHKDIIVSSLDIERILDAWGKETERCGDYDTGRPQDDELYDLLYTVDLRFDLTEDGKKRLFNDLPILTDSIIIDGKSIPTSELSGYDANDLNFGGMYISFDVAKDGRVIMDTDGFIPTINGSGEYISVDPQSLSAVEDVFYEFAGGKDKFRDHILSELKLEYGITKDHLRLPVPQENRAKIDMEKLFCDAIKVCDEKRIRELFPEADLDDITTQRWEGNLFQCVEIDGDMNVLEIGLYCEGPHYEESMLDSPWTLQAFWGDDVVYCKSVEKNEKILVEEETTKDNSEPPHQVNFLLDEFKNIYENSNDMEEKEL